MVGGGGGDCGIAAPESSGWTAVQIRSEVARKPLAALHGSGGSRLSSPLLLLKVGLFRQGNGQVKAE